MSLTHGYVQIYTGEGKGKTTAALGLLMRCVGEGLNVCFIQFLKQRATSEIKTLKRLPEVTVYRFGTSGWVIGRPNKQACQQAERGLKRLRQCLLSRKFDCIIADELCVAVKLGLLKESDVLETMANRSQTVELVLTGRGATAGLRRAADLVTEMKAIKHYYSKGVPARNGIEQ